MRLRSDKFKALAEERGLTDEQLAQAIDRVGLTGARALTAIRNWKRGSDHPRCKIEDIRALAQALGASPQDFASFVSQVRRHRGSTQKARLVADMIRGRGVDEAMTLLTFSQKRAATNVRKALEAAIAEADEIGADVTSLYVSESRVDEGPVIKRFRPKDRGRAHPIMKQTSHITIGVQEREPAVAG